MVEGDSSVEAVSSTDDLLPRALSALEEERQYTRELEAELETCLADYEEVSQHLLKILLSPMWQAMYPLRVVGEGQPRVRSLLRWIATWVPWIRKRRTTQVDRDMLAMLRRKSKRGVARQDARTDMLDSLRRELDTFLASNSRLMFSRHENPDVSVLIVLWNQAHFTLECLRKLVAQNTLKFEIILVDNGSTDQTAELLSRVDGVTVIRNESNEGFLRATNRAAAAARGSNLLLLNNDAFPRRGAIAAARATLESDPSIGAVGGRLILPSGLLQEAGSIVWSDGSTLGYARGRPAEAGEAMFRRDVDYCSGAFLMTPRGIWNRLGGLDDSYAPAYYEETDYCMRLRELGLRVVYEPAAAVDHFEFGSEVAKGDAIELMTRNRRRFRERHAAALGSEYYAPSQGNTLLARTRAACPTRTILFIDDVVPLQSLGAGRPRAKELVVEMAAAGWSVTVFPLRQLNVEWTTVRREIPPDVEIVSGYALPELTRFLAERRGYFDTILVSRPHNLAHLRAAVREDPSLLQAVRLIYDAEALYAIRDVAAAALAGTPYSEAAADRLIAAEVRDVSAGVDAITCVTPIEQALFRRHQVGSVPVYRLGHPIRLAEGVPDFGERRGFLFVGRLLEKDAPNWTGLEWFVRESWPLIRAALPEATLTVVGRIHHEHAEFLAPGIRVLGVVDALQPVFDAARVFVAPVRFAAGLPLKILDATAAGLPTLGTTLMGRQLEWLEDDAIACADDAASIAAAAVRMHEDPVVWAAIRSRAQKRLLQDHGAGAFRQTLRDVLGPCQSGLARMRVAE